MGLYFPHPVKRRLSSELAAPSSPLGIGRRLGEGATSVVFQAEVAGVEVALKIARDPKFAARLADEADRLLMVGSTALAQVVDAGFVPHGTSSCEELEGHAYIALELAPGAPLAPTVKQAGRARAELALIVARDVAEALADLHAAGSAHGDVKPANVIFDPRARHARLVDLGLGTEVGEENVRGGTRRYLAPEVFTEGSGGDARSRDLWAFGLLLAELASPELARSTDPTGCLGAVELPPIIGEIARALLDRAPRARPSAEWVHRRALEALGGAEADSTRRRRAVERAYLGVRRREILHAATRHGARILVEGLPGRWLHQATDLARRVSALRGRAPEGGSPTLGELDAFGRSRWLVALIGASAAHWPVPRAGSDSELCERLLALCEGSDPASFALASIDSGIVALAVASDEPVELALALASGTPPAQVLDRAEHVVRGGGAPVLALVLARALRARGEYGRALSVLELASPEDAALEKAETLRRAGDSERALQLLGEPLGLDITRESRRAATLARIELDAGHPERARAALSGVVPTAASLEVRALIELALEDRRAATDSALYGVALAANDEEHARLAAVQGFVAHAAGDAQTAAESYRRAVDHAVRAGALLEEATYLTGLSAAAATLGHFAEALDAGRRALLLFDHLRRPKEAARAALSRAAVFAQAGAVAETREAAADCIARARIADDCRCRGYAHLALADVLPDGDAEGVEQALRAQTLLATSGSDDQLHVGARLLRRGQAVDIAALDARARSSEASIEPRLEWWGARARAEAESERPNRPEVVLAELSAAFSAPTPLGIRGPALAAGANLGARIGQADTARRLALGAREAAREIARHAPPELRAAIDSLPWLVQLESPRETDVSAEQVSDVETLVHALGRRDRLRPLLDQVLDALILWTGVERGLLLLRAPGGKLSPRAGRNLARADLRGEQLALSMSLAERAMEQREPVVAVDAAGELPDVHASVHALKLRSVLAVPLISRGEMLGVVYLDDRIRRGAFGAEELAWVRLVAALASVAIADARDQLLLRRAARRARRAEARLSVELAQREAALDVAERELARARDAEHPLPLRRDHRRQRAVECAAPARRSRGALRGPGAHRRRIGHGQRARRPRDPRQRQPPRGPSSARTAAPSPRRCSSRRSSVTCAARSPALRARGRASSRSPTAARCSSTRSPR